VTHGPINSIVPGRIDKIPLRVAPGAYVLPADVPSGLGQGNTVAGAHILNKMFGATLRQDTRRERMFAGGGSVPIVAAGGEYVISPEVVREVGSGSIGRGHKILDAFVRKTRAQHIKTLRNLPGPKT